jgi:endonuclease/exonuclease/phosphatase family metal-dependent hydrolase
MRRYEARLLRKVISGIMKKEPGANVLVMGDMNDTFDSGAVAAVRGDALKEPMRLVDLRPVDSDGCCWTHWWRAQDSYGRIDYAFASKGLLPEIERGKNRIVHIPFSWLKASDHRPLEVFIDTDLEKR